VLVSKWLLVRKLNFPNVVCGGREVQSLQHSADAIPDGFSDAVPGMKERVGGALSPAAGRGTLHRVQLPAMSHLASALEQLEQERNRLFLRLEQLNEAVSALTGATSNRRGKISAAGRAQIAAAQRARWAKAKSQRIVSIGSRRRHRMSAAAIARIRAAQKARWAKWRKAKKAA
jgi:hypothetical protein